LSTNLPLEQLLAAASFDPGWDLWHDSVMSALAAVSAEDGSAYSTSPQICRESLRVRVAAYSRAWLKCPNAGCAWAVLFGCEGGLSKEMAVRKLTNHHLYDHTYLKEREENSSVGGQEDEKLEDVTLTEKEESKWLKDVQKLLSQEEEDGPVRLSLLLSDLLDDVEGACNVAGARENSGLKGLFIDVTPADAARVAGKEAVVGGLWALESGTSPSCRLHCAKYLLKAGEAQKIKDVGLVDGGSFECPHEGCERTEPFIEGGVSKSKALLKLALHHYEDHLHQVSKDAKEVKELGKAVSKLAEHEIHTASDMMNTALKGEWVGHRSILS
jgi:hypothetical protein